VTTAGRCQTEAKISIFVDYFTGEDTRMEALKGISLRRRKHVEIWDISQIEGSWKEKRWKEEKEQNWKSERLFRDIFKDCQIIAPSEVMDSSTTWKRRVIGGGASGTSGAQWRIWNRKGKTEDKRKSKKGRERKKKDEMVKKKKEAKMKKKKEAKMKKKKKKRKKKGGLRRKEKMTSFSARCGAGKLFGPEFSSDNAGDGPEYVEWGDQLVTVRQMKLILAN
jgi:hypothetical protein